MILKFKPSTFKFLFRLFQPLIFNFVNNSRIKQGCGVAKALCFAFGNFSQYPAHDLSAACLWQAAHQLDLIGFCNGADHPCHSFQNIFSYQFFIRNGSVENDKRVDRLPFYIMRVTNNCAFDNTCVHVDGILHFSGTDAVAAYIQHIVHAAGDAVIPILIF